MCEIMISLVRNQIVSSKICSNRATRMKIFQQKTKILYSASFITSQKEEAVRWANKGILHSDYRSWCQQNPSFSITLRWSIVLHVHLTRMQWKVSSSSSMAANCAAIPHHFTIGIHSDSVSSSVCPQALLHSKEENLQNLWLSRFHVLSRYL